MKRLGFLLLCVGLLSLAYALTMDTSVPVHLGYFGGVSDHVFNFDLAAKKQSMLIASGTLIVAGAIIACRRDPDHTEQEHDAEITKELYKTSGTAKDVISSLLNRLRLLTFMQKMEFVLFILLFFPIIAVISRPELSLLLTPFLGYFYVIRNAERVEHISWSWVIAVVLFATCIILGLNFVLSQGYSLTLL